jgi:cytochrome c oxidase subunit 2
MEIHRYEKLWFGLSLLLIVAFIGTITYGAVGVGVQMVSDDGGTVDPDNIGEHEKFQDWPQPRAQHVEGDQYEVAIQAIRFNFLPGGTQPIEVPENSEVTFYITSPDVTHGFNIVGTNVNTMVIPGQMAEITVEFGEYDEREEMGILCNEFCGAGHEEMAGEIHVLPEEEWEQGGQDE